MGLEKSSGGGSFNGYAYVGDVSIISTLNVQALQPAGMENNTSKMTGVTLAAGDFLVADSVTVVGVYSAAQNMVYFTNLAASGTISMVNKTLKVYRKK